MSRKNQSVKGDRISEAAKETGDTKMDRQAAEIEDTVARMRNKHPNVRLAKPSTKNDPDWYDNIPGLLEPVGRLPYYYPVGSKVSTSAGSFVVPGVTEMKYIPTYGICQNAGDALNVAMSKVYTYLRSKNSRLTFDNPDFGCYIITVDNLMMYHAYMERAYGILRNYNWANQYTPRALLAAMGLDYADLLSNMPQLLFHLRDISNKLKNLPFPDVFDMFNRHDYFARNYFCDADALKCQFYVPHLTHLWQFDNTTTTGSAMKVVRFTKDGQGVYSTLQDCINVFNQLYNAILLDEDIQTMGGAILKAFEGKAIRGIGETNEDYICTPVYNDLTLEQIKNCDALNGVISEGVTTITQVNEINNGYLQTTVGIDITSDGSGGALPANVQANRVHMLNTMIDEPSALDNIEITRLIFTTEAGSWTTIPGFIPVNVTSVGAELIYNISIMADPFGPWGVTNNVYHFHSHILLGESLTITQFETICAISQFHCHPTIYYYQMNEGKLELVGILRNIENYTLFTNDEIKNLNDAALRSLLNFDF